MEFVVAHNNWHLSKRKFFFKMWCFFVCFRNHFWFKPFGAIYASQPWHLMGSMSPVSRYTALMVTMYIHWIPFTSIGYQFRASMTTICIHWIRCVNAHHLHSIRASQLLEILSESYYAQCNMKMKIVFSILLNSNPYSKSGIILHSVYIYIFLSTSCSPTLHKMLLWLF